LNRACVSRATAAVALASWPDEALCPALGEEDGWLLIFRADPQAAHIKTAARMPKQVASVAGGGATDAVNAIVSCGADPG
jgi:hypothetical protein